jgi:hypothetical protein
MAFRLVSAASENLWTTTMSVTRETITMEIPGIASIRNSERADR